MRVVLFIAAITLGVAQAPADFSGQRIVETPAAPAAGGPPPSGDMGSGWGSTITVTQNATRLIVEPVVYSRYDLQPQPRLEYALDGSETRNTLMLGRGVQTLSSRAAWDGQRLRITTVHPYVDPASGKPLAVDVTQTLALESPTRLVVDATRSAALGGRPSTTRTIYTKR
jgi:hypothetical protein